MTIKMICAAVALNAAIIPVAYAHDGDGGNVTYASDHAPIGVMADHRHKKGEWMVSYRYMYMDMEGNRIGTDEVDPDPIVTTVPNRFAGAPMMPPTLRVVPLEMPMQMHMGGAMYGLADRITLMGMVNYITKEMDLRTYMGGMGTNVLGDFTTEVSGFGDTSVGAIIGLDDGSYEHRQVNLSVMVSIPTGSITETDTVLTPMNMQTDMRLPYPMQLGSGTYDLKPALTARSRSGRWSYGAQVSGVIRLDDNDEGYALGDVLEGTAWLAFEPQPWVSISGRLKAKSQGQIDGIDPRIMAPVQTADPDYQGSETVEALFGVNLAGSEGWKKGHRLALEFGVPLHRDLNGPQMETDYTLTLGWQKAF
ncbi:transporter [Henriciella sp. AS95]|uniref:transporter n=1 Tax=Henriciella sp. AS95 TaxID=3135782 RepID=UPI003171BB5B